MAVPEPLRPQTFASAAGGVFLPGRTPLRHARCLRTGVHTGGPERQRTPPGWPELCRDRAVFPEVSVPSVFSH